MKLNFKTDEQSKNYCMKIVDELVSKYCISEDEAIRRINNFWYKAEIIGDDDMIYHELPIYWAKAIINETEK